MYENFIKDYDLITGADHQSPPQVSPEEQGKLLKKCSILSSTEISYSCNVEYNKN